MSRAGTGMMIALFWTGLANGPAGASGAPAPEISQSVVVAVASEPDAVDLWLADVAACEAGLQDRCAPVLR